MGTAGQQRTGRGGGLLEKEAKTIHNPKTVTTVHCAVEGAEKETESALSAEYDNNAFISVNCSDMVRQTQ